MPHTANDPRVQRIVDFFESLQPASVRSMDLLYSESAYFKDPFNEVRGLPQIQQIFDHMYVALHQPHFVITETVTQGHLSFIVWEFRFRFKRFDRETPQVVRGCSHLRLQPDGRIVYHRDYWDAAEELYEKLPIVSHLMRWLKRRANS